MGWCHIGAAGRNLEPRQLLFDEKKKKRKRVSPCQPTPAAIFSTSPLRNLTLPAWIDTKNVTNPSFALYRLNLRGEEGNANFFLSQLMENISFVVKFFFFLIPLQFQWEGVNEYREYRVPIVVKFGINSPFEFNSIPIPKWNIERWEHCTLTLCCEIQ